MKSRGPRIEPWGTPVVICDGYGRTSVLTFICTVIIYWCHVLCIHMYIWVLYWHPILCIDMFALYIIICCCLLLCTFTCIYAVIGGTHSSIFTCMYCSHQVVSRPPKCLQYLCMYQLSVALYLITYSFLIFHSCLSASQTNTLISWT